MSSRHLPRAFCSSFARHSNPGRLSPLPTRSPYWVRFGAINMTVDPVVLSYVKAVITMDSITTELCTDARSCEA